MSKITSFEDLLAWQEARKLANILYRLTDKFPSSEKYNFIDQIRRAAVSVTNNIAEGFGRYHSPEAKQFYRIARGSLLEIKSMLYLASDRDYLTKDDLKETLYKIDTASKLISGLIRKVDSYRNTKL